MNTRRITLELTDDEFRALVDLCDHHYPSLAAIVQYLACTAASYTHIARGELEDGYLLAQAAQRVHEL